MSNSFFKRFKKDETPEINDDDELEEVQDRFYWVSLLEKIVKPVIDNLSVGSLIKTMPYESENIEGRKFAYLEAFARVFNGIAPWLELGSDSTYEGKIRERYINLTINSISNAVKPNHNDFIFIVEPKQSLVDIALFAEGLLRCKNQIWLNLPIDVQARIIREFKNTRIIAPYENHWLLYTSMIEAALLEFTGECDIERLTYGIYKFKDEFYIGDALYSDGERFELNYFNSLIIHPMLNDILFVMRKYGIQEGEFLDIQLMRSSRLAAELERLISPEGTYPLVGKSLSYRCGVFHGLAQAALLEILPRNIKLAQVRCALTKVLENLFSGEKNFSKDGWLVRGVTGLQTDICEYEINTGSLYLCCAVFLPLGLSFDNPFWREPYEKWSSVKVWDGEELNTDKSVDF